MTAVEEIQKSAESLTAQERDDLIAALIAKREREQDAKISRRIGEIDKGEVEGISSKQLIAEARKRLDDCR